MKIDWFVYSFYLLIIFFPCLNSHSINYDISLVETQLIRRLLNESTYSKRVRPSHKVVVDIRFLFNQIISMVEKEQIIVTNCFVDQKWTGRIELKEQIENKDISRSTIAMESSRVSEYHLDSNASNICLVNFISKNDFPDQIL